MTALAIVRPSLDSNLFYTPLLGGMLIGLGVTPFAVAIVTPPTHGVGRVGAAIASLGGLGLLLGLLGDVVRLDALRALALPGLLIVLVGMLIFGGSLAASGDERRVIGVFITSGLVASLILFPGVDPIGIGLVLKAAAQSVAALSFGLGCAALARQELTQESG
jgi:hypothetical protein